MQRFHIAAVSGVTALSAYWYKKLKHEANTSAQCEQQQQQQQQQQEQQQEQLQSEQPQEQQNQKQPEQAKQQTPTVFNGHHHSHLSPTRPLQTWNYNWDLRQPSDTPSEGSSASETPTATRHVLMIRHGQYFHDEGGDLLRKLTELGRQQAWHTGQRLEKLNIKFDRIVISTMTRAEETGGIIADFLPNVEREHCSLLREGRPIRPETKSSRMDSIGWQRGVFVDGPRIEGAFRKYIHRADTTQTEDSYDLLVCHANVIRYFVVRAMQCPPDYWLKMSLAHCGITWISIPPNGELQVRTYGESGHLPPEMVTFHNIDPPKLKK